MSVQEVQKMLTKKLSAALEPHGFKHSGGTFCRQAGELTHIINLQGDKWNQGSEGKYYVNLAVYYGQAAAIEYGNPTLTVPKEYDGQLRNRLQGAGIPTSWDFSSKVDNAKRSDELVDAVIVHGLPYFEGIDSPLQLADCIMDKKKDGMIMITGHISRAVIFSLLGDKSRAQSEFDTYFKKNKCLKDNDPTSKMIKRQYLCVAQKVGLQLNFPELNGETCVGFYIAMKGKQLVHDERWTRSKLEVFLRNLEKKDLGYLHYYGQLRKPGAYRIGFCTKDPAHVVQYITEREDKFANPLQAIVTNDEF